MIFFWNEGTFFEYPYFEWSLHQTLLVVRFGLKDKSGVGTIVDYSRDYTVVNGVEYFFQFFPF